MLIRLKKHWYVGGLIRNLPQIETYNMDQALNSKWPDSMHLYLLLLIFDTPVFAQGEIRFSFSYRKIYFNFALCFGLSTIDRYTNTYTRVFCVQIETLIKLQPTTNLLPFSYKKKCVFAKEFHSM